MAIGVRRDRGGVMPATESYPSLVSVAAVKGDLVKLTSGKLVICDDGDATSEDQIFLVVSNYVSGVTGPTVISTDTPDRLVMPLTDNLTFIGPVTESTGGAVESLVPGSTLGINSTGDGFLDASAASADVVVIKLLEGTAGTAATTGTGVVEVRFLFDTDTT